MMCAAMRTVTQEKDIGDRETNGDVDGIHGSVENWTNRENLHAFVPLLETQTWNMYIFFGGGDFSDVMQVHCKYHWKMDMSRSAAGTGKHQEALPAEAERLVNYATTWRPLARPTPTSEPTTKIAISLYIYIHTSCILPTPFYTYVDLNKNNIYIYINIHVYIYDLWLCIHYTG